MGSGTPMPGKRCHQENEMADAEIKRLMKDLGQSINETLSDSTKINESIQSIRDAGYEVYLIIEAKIGFSRESQVEDESLAHAAKSEETAHLNLTLDDAKFLKSLKIAVDDPK
jgi:hypothetical protein